MKLLSRLGRSEDARAAFAHALRLATTDAERRLLARRLAELVTRTRVAALDGEPLQWGAVAV